MLTPLGDPSVMLRDVADGLHHDACPDCSAAVSLLRTLAGELEPLSAVNPRLIGARGGQTTGATKRRGDASYYRRLAHRRLRKSK